VVIGPGVKLDFRHLPDGHVISPQELDAELARIGHTLSPGDIVLINTAAGRRAMVLMITWSGAAASAGRARCT
jgi:hypothetical protein